MTQLLEIRDNIKSLLAKYDVFIFPVLKFLMALITLLMINSKLGYMSRLNNIGIVLILSLACSFLPSGAIMFFGAVVSLGHVFSLSPEVAIIIAVIYLLIYLLYLRFTPSESLCIVVTPIMFVLHIPYVVPVVMGLIGGPASALSVVCGVIVYFALHTVTVNAANVSGNISDLMSEIRLIIDSLLGNKQMIVLVFAFAVVTITVYVVRRLPIERAWTLAEAGGAFFCMLIVLIGGLVQNAGFSVIGILFGCILSFAVGKVIEFFRFCVDYTRTERVQFEDDDYYYFVKAVPKMNVAAPQRKVKNINRSHKSYVAKGRVEPAEEIYEDEYMDDFLANDEDIKIRTK